MKFDFVMSIVTVLILAAVHPLSAALAQHHLRNRTTSFCAGIALAYLFLHLLPELSNLQFELLKSRGEGHPRLWFEEHVYVLALIGLLLFQIVDNIGRGKGKKSAKIFSYKAELSFFSLYSVLIAYLIITTFEQNQPSLLITVAFAAHFIGTDIDLTERYQDVFVKKGSYVLSIATITGMLIAVFSNVSNFAYTFGFSFLAGGILINTLRTELPEPQNVKNGFLLLGTISYSVLILLIYYMIRKG